MGNNFQLWNYTDLKSKINTLKSSLADSLLEKSIIVSMIFVVANINCTGIKYFLNGEC